MTPDVKRQTAVFFAGLILLEWKQEDLEGIGFHFTAENPMRRIYKHGNGFCA